MRMETFGWSDNVFNWIGARLGAALTSILRGKSISRLVRPGTFQYECRCFEDNFDVKQQRTIAGVLQIQPNHFFKWKLTASSNLPQASDPRLHTCTTFSPLGKGAAHSIG